MNSSPSNHAAAPTRRRAAFLLPLALFGASVIVLGIGLSRDPREVPSPLIDKPVPVFELPPVKGRSQGLASRYLAGEVSLVNATGACTACPRPS